MTTTPRPTKLVRELVAEAADPDGDVHLIRGSTYDNRANLSDAFLKRIEKRYAGTRLGRQELHAEVLEDVEGALWTWATINEARAPLTGLTLDPKLVEEKGWHAAVLEALGLHRVVVAVDPAVLEQRRLGRDRDRRRRLHAGPRAGRRPRRPLRGLLAPRVGDRREAGPRRLGRRPRRRRTEQRRRPVQSNLRTVDRTLHVKTVWAARGKALRAEPVAALYEQGRVAHLAWQRANTDGEILARLQAQMCEWVPGVGKSPDMIDALVYALTETLLPERKPSRGRTALV